MVNPHGNICAHEKFYSKMPDYTKYLKTFAWMKLVQSIVSVKANLEYQGITFMLVGYA